MLHPGLIGAVGDSFADVGGDRVQWRQPDVAEFQYRFHWHLESLDIRHVYIRPRTPHLNGKVERSHRVDEQEFYQLLDKDGIADDIHLFKQARTTVLRGRIVPLRALNDLLGLDAAPLRNAEGELAVLVVRIGNQNVGLLVDQFQGASDIILKPLEGVLAGLVGFAGTALMGDGGVLMVINPKELLA